MGAGASKKKYTQEDETPGFDHNAWRTPKIKTPAGPVQLPSERRDDCTTWSPRQGGKKLAEKQAEKERKEKAASQPSLPSLPGPKLPGATGSQGPVSIDEASFGASRTAGFAPALTDSDFRRTGFGAASKEYTPALENLGADEAPPEPEALTAEEDERVDVAALLEEMDGVWKKLLLKRQGAGSNMGSLFKATELRDQAQEAAKAVNDAEGKKALAAAKVDAKVRHLEDRCRDLEAKALRNIGTSAIWKRHDLAIRKGDSLCEVMVAKPRNDVSVRMCVAGNTVTVERANLIPLDKSELNEMRELKREFEHAKMEKLGLQPPIKAANREFRRVHQQLIDELETELRELEENPEYAPPGTVSQSTAMVIGWDEPTNPALGLTSYPQMQGLISAAEMMLQAKAGGAAGAARGAKAASKSIPTNGTAISLTNQSASVWVAHKTPEGETYYHNDSTNVTAWELPEGAVAKEAGAKEEEMPAKATDTSESRSSSKDKEEKSKAPSPTVPTGSRPPWQEPGSAPPKRPAPSAPKIWREPGLAMPSQPPKDSAKFPPPPPAAAEALPGAVKRSAATEPASSDAVVASFASPTLATANAVPAAAPVADAATPTTRTAATVPGAATVAPAATVSSAATPVATAAPAATNFASPAPAVASQATPTPVKVTYWTEVKTPDGETYYHNEANDETAWELPPGGVVRKAEEPSEKAEEPLESAPATEQPAASGTAPTSLWTVIQTGDGETYYHNEETGDTAWELPPGGKVKEPDAGSVSSQAVSGQLSPSFQQKPAQQLQMPQEHVPSWTAVQTAEGQVYYHNQRTGETSWELPSDVLYSPCADSKGANAGASSFAGMWQAPAQAAEAHANPSDPWAGMRQAQAAEEAARQQREQYEAAMRQAQAVEEAARQQREQWDAMYAQHWAWFQQQQQQQQQQGSSVTKEASAGLVPPGLDATMEDQILFAMKCNVVQEMEEMLKRAAPLNERKKALKQWQIKWHPDKNPDQAEVAKGMFQFIGEKRMWFLHDTDLDTMGAWEDLPVDMPD